MFDPYDLTADITPKAISIALEEKRYGAALMMSFKLNERDLLVKCIEAVPIRDGKIIHNECFPFVDSEIFRECI